MADPMRLIQAAGGLQRKAASRAETLETNHPWDGKSMLDGATQPQWRERERALRDYAGHVMTGGESTPAEAAAEAEGRAKALEGVKAFPGREAPELDGRTAWQWREHGLALRELDGAVKGKDNVVPLTREQRTQRDARELSSWEPRRLQGETRQREERREEAQKAREDGVEPRNRRQEQGATVVLRA